MFSQSAVRYLDKSSIREIEENEWLKEKVRGSLALSLSWQFRFEMQWPKIMAVSSDQIPKTLMGEMKRVLEKGALGIFKWEIIKKPWRLGHQREENQNCRKL